MSLSDFYRTAAIPKVYRAPRVRRPGPTARRRKAKATRLIKIAKPIRDEVRALDGYACRWPECQVPLDTFWGALEVAHYKAAGMGGDPTLERYTPTNLLCICRWHHRGPRGLHSPFAKLRPLTDDLGMRGPVECFQRERGESGKWYAVGISKLPQQGRYDCC